jgi:hypothetical protein
MGYIDNLDLKSFIWGAYLSSHIYHLGPQSENQWYYWSVHGDWYGPISLEEAKKLSKEERPYLMDTDK